MTQHIRNTITKLNQHNLTTWPQPWPQRIQQQLNTINNHTNNATNNLAALAHTPPPTNPATRPQRQHGDTPPTPTEARAQALITGPGQTINQLHTHLTTANNHLTTGTNNPPNQRHHAQQAWQHLGHACTIIEKWQTIDPQQRETLLCNGLGLPGYFEWGQPECHMIAAANPTTGSTNLNGLCLDCHHKREAWNSRQYRRHHTIHKQTVGA